MAILKNTTFTTTGSINPPVGSTGQRDASNPRTVVTLTSGSGTWTVPAGVTNIQVLVVAGGGGGAAGGGGAGGLIYNSGYQVTPGASILYSIGAGGSTVPTAGANTVFGTLTAIGGGRGGPNDTYGPIAGMEGGSGGGGGRTSTVNPCRGGYGLSGQGFKGGSTNNISNPYPGSGGGGAGGPGAGPLASNAAGGGGIGLPFSISGTMQWYAGGGGGGIDSAAIAGKGGLGGGGDGGSGTGGVAPVAGTANTGGGGGGNNFGAVGGAGGSGVIIISYVPDSYLGQYRYNSDGQIAEIYESTGWKSLTPRANYGTSNALLYSSDLTNNIWTKDGTSLTTGQQAPDGSMTAFLMTENTVAAADHRLYQLPVLGAGGPSFFVSSIFVKYTSTRRYFLLRHGSSGGYGGAYFDLQTRTVASQYGGVIGEVIPAANGWMQLKCTLYYNTGTYSDVVWAMSNVASGGNNPTYSGDGSSSVLIWKPELYTATDIEANGYRTHIYRNCAGSQFFTPSFTGNVELLVVGGGGSGASTYGGTGNGPRGGGGAGGVIYVSNYQVTAGTAYPITVGAGGVAVSGNNVNGNQGANSLFGNVVALGGGYGGYYNANNATAGTGGSGGGNAYASQRTGGQPGAGNFGAGAVSGSGGAGGGGGAGGPGREAAGSDTGGDGGRGLAFDISGVTTYYGGGGGAGGYPQGRNDYGLGGIGGGGRGGQGYDQSSSIAGPQGGQVATGGGGGAGGAGAEGGAGGSGIVIVRYQAPTKCAIIYQSGYWTAPAGVTKAKVLVVAGGGGGGEDMGGGGGAGGLLFDASYPIEAGRTYTVTIGAGGAGARASDIIRAERGQNGGNSVFGTMTAIGGGGGASLHDVSSYPASSGGSGGGASGGGRLPSGGSGGTGGYGGGIRGTGTAGQGNDGGDSIGTWYPTGGGGAGGAGTCNPGKGGDGLPFNLAGPMLYFAGGGGGSGYSATGGNGGLGGGGAGAVLTPVYGGGWSLNWGQYGNGGRTGWQVGYMGSHAGANTGGGGGGGSHYNNANAGGNGGSGVVIIKWD